MVEFFKKIELQSGSNKAEKKDNEITEEMIDKEINESPQIFEKWFDKLKGAISFWPDKFKKEKLFRDAIICASIPFSILQASERSVSAEEISLKLAKISMASEQMKIIEQAESVELVKLETRVRSEDLISLTDGESKIILSQKINKELNVFDRLSNAFNDVVTEKKDLFPQEVINKISNGEKIFDFSGRMENKIKEANQYIIELGAEDGLDIKNEKKIKNIKKILDNGKISFTELIKSFPEAVFALNLSVLVHEIGHQEEVERQGGKSEGITIYPGIFARGFLEHGGTVKNKAAISVAGIKSDKEFGEFLVNGLRNGDSSQILAIMALAAKSNGMLYALRTNFIGQENVSMGDDIANYAKLTNSSVSDLAIGLVADFILDKDNWKLMQVALGKEGVEIPESTIAPMYELGEHGPVVGIKYKKVF